MIPLLLNYTETARKSGQIKIEPNNLAGTKCKGTWTLNKYNHNSFQVAIARVPGITKPYWPIARPYQPESIEWNPSMIGATGAVWLDEDGNGEKNSAYNYAKTLVESSEGTFEKLTEQLEGFDQAVTIQAAGIFINNEQKVLTLSDEIYRLIESSADHVQEGFETYLNYLWETAEK